MKLSTYCLDLYAPQLWNYSSIKVQLSIFRLAQNYTTHLETAQYYSLFVITINDYSQKCCEHRCYNGY